MSCRCTKHVSNILSCFYETKFKTENIKKRNHEFKQIEKERQEKVKFEIERRKKREKKNKQLQTVELLHKERRVKVKRN